VVHHLGAHDPLGGAVDLGGDDGAGDGCLDVPFLDPVGHAALGREQEAGAHGDTRGAVGQRSHQSPAVEVAPGGDDEDAIAHGVDYLRHEQ